MKYYVIAGEASGDLYASGLIRELKSADPSAQFRCWGGDLMQAEGAKIVKHYRDLAFMGFVEVLMNLRTILKNIDFCKKDILEHRPDALILVDYPGFNLRIAKWARQHGIRVYYYISPGVWAWKASRVNVVKENVERLFAILPFEKAFYAARGVEVDYFGHPLAELIRKEKEKMVPRAEFLKKHNLSEKPIIAMLPGSRKQELKYILPELLKVIKHFPGYQFVIGASSTLPREIYDDIAKQYGISYLINETYPLLFHAHAGLIKSGTSTLEAALFDLPHVVCYNANAISLFIARRVATVNYFSLVNIIMNKLTVAELLQDEMNEQRIVAELTAILDGPKRNQLLAAYNILHGMLESDNVSRKIAEEIVRRLRN